MLEQSVPGSNVAEEGSKILLTVGEVPEVSKVPDLVGLGYTEAEDKLEQAGYLLGGVEEAPSERVPAGVIMKQDPQPGTTLDPSSYVYLTTSVGPPDTNNSGRDKNSARPAASTTLPARKPRSLSPYGATTRP